MALPTGGFAVTRTLLVTLLIAAPASAQWPQWRGPAGDGVAPAGANPPAEWAADKNVLAQIPLPGPGAGTPCVSGGKLFFTAQVADGIVLLCVGEQAGQILWTRPLGSGEGKFRGDEGNLASASCSTDGKLVYAFAGNGTLAAFDFAGKEVWKLDCQKNYGAFKIQFGAHWTPALDAGKLYLQLFHRGAQLLVCLDAATGTEVWKAERASDSPPGTESPDVYSSPQIWRKGDKSYLVAHGNDYCTAHSLVDGKELWRVGELNPKSNYNRHWRAVASPLVTPELIVVPSCKNGVVVGVDPEKASGLVLPGTPGEKWRMARGTPDVPSPILAAGTLYLVSERGRLSAHDPATGEELAGQQLTNERHRANPVFAGGKLYLVGREGTTPVVKPQLEVVAKNKLPDTFTASPAVAGGKLYLRGWKYLWVIGAN